MSVFLRKTFMVKHESMAKSKKPIMQPTRQSSISVAPYTDNPTAT